MSTPDPKVIAQKLVSGLPGWEGEPEMRPGVVPLASPMYQAVDSQALRLSDAAEKSAWLKILSDDALLFTDPETAVTAARAAGVAGVGPEVLASQPATAAILMADLSATHRVGTLDRLAERPIREGVIAARKAMHATPSLPISRTVFDHIETLTAQATTAGVAFPQDWLWMADNIAAAGAAIRAAGFDTVPAHGDGNVSNLMIDDRGGVLLVDFDMAANMDPFEDLGSFLVEAHAFDPGAQETFEMFHGCFDAGLFNRARLYGVADDVRWGLIGATLAKTSARKDLEFLKYAEWRFLRARLAMRDPRFEERVRRV